MRDLRNGRAVNKDGKPGGADLQVGNDDTTYGHPLQPERKSNSNTFLNEHAG